MVFFGAVKPSAPKGCITIYEKAQQRYKVLLGKL
jgi:hypothetical protein